MAIYNCGHDENGKYSGGKAGDQTGTEWEKRSWYSRPWDYVLRYSDEVGNLLSVLASEAAANNLIGYDQSQRTTFYDHLKASKWRPKGITIACEADCSSGTAALVIAVGQLLGIDALKKVSKDLTTRDMRSALKNAGFKVLTDGKYLKSEEFLKAGDILLSEGHHVAIEAGVTVATAPSVEPSKVISGETIFQLVQKVVNGELGSGDVRKKALGSLYTSVQAATNGYLKTISIPEATRIIKCEIDNGKLSNVGDLSRFLEGYWGLIYSGATYTVQKGDTLSKIAKLYGTTIDKLATDNNISNINNINVGQRLTIVK